MRKRIVIAMVTGMVIASLAGCGTQADATNQSPESSSAVESQPEPTASETGSDAESKTESTESSETTSEEVVGDNAETSESGDLEDDNIILYAENRGKGLDIIPEELEYAPYDGVLNAESVVGLFDGQGYRIGEMKIGGTVYISEMNIANNRARFKNPIEDSDYDYLYVSASYVESNNKSRISASDAEAIIKEVLGNEDVYTYTDVTDDMELFEFRIPMYYDETKSPKDVIHFQFRNFCEDIWYHHTFAIMCTEDTDDYILCQIYYKD